MDTIRHYSMLIGGQRVDTPDRFEIRSPATEELVATVAKGADFGPVISAEARDRILRYAGPTRCCSARRRRRRAERVRAGR